MQLACVYNRSSVNSPCPSVMASYPWWSIWRPLGLPKTQEDVCTCEGFFLISLFEVERLILSLIFWYGKIYLKSESYLLVAPYIKGMKEALSRLHTLVHSFTGMRATFCAIPTFTKNQLRHPALWTIQLLDSWTVCWETVIVKLAGP